MAAVGSRPAGRPVGGRSRIDAKMVSGRFATVCGEAAQSGRRDAAGGPLTHFSVDSDRCAQSTCRTVVKWSWAVLRSSFRPEKAFFDRVSGSWSRGAEFRVECRRVVAAGTTRKCRRRVLESIRSLRGPPPDEAAQMAAARVAAAASRRGQHQSAARGRRALRNRPRMSRISPPPPPGTPWTQAAAAPYRGSAAPPAGNTETHRRHPRRGHGALQRRQTVDRAVTTCRPVTGQR